MALSLLLQVKSDLSIYTWMTPHQQYEDILCFSYDVVVVLTLRVWATAVCAVILSVVETPE